MVFEKKQLNIIYLASDRFEFYSPTFSSPLAYYFPPQIIKDLEVKDEEALAFEVQSFIERNKLTPASLVVILSESVCFEKDFTKSSELNLQFETQRFLDDVPFENTLTKLYKEDDKVRLVVTNQDLTQALINAFVRQGFSILGVAPAFILGEVTLAKGLDSTFYGKLLGKVEILKQQTIYTPQVEPGEKKEGEKKQSGNRRTFFLMVILVVLVMILMLLIIKSNTTPSIPPKPKIVFSESSPTPTFGLSQTLRRVEEVKVQIVAIPELIEVAESLRQKLTSFDFKQIEMEESLNLVSEKTLIIFSRNLPLDLRQKLISEVGRVFADYTVQESDETKYDVVIIVGKSK